VKLEPLEGSPNHVSSNDERLSVFPNPFHWRFSRADEQDTNWGQDFFDGRWKLRSELAGILKMEDSVSPKRALCIETAMH
jgi:hypothetical protein